MGAKQLCVQSPTSCGKGGDRAAQEGTSSGSFSCRSGLVASMLLLSGKSALKSDLLCHVGSVWA